MAGPSTVQAKARNAVKLALLSRLENLADATHPADVANTVVVAVSGGADSLALAATTQWVASRMGLKTVAVIVDHGLQEGSAAVAQAAASNCQKLGIKVVEIMRVQIATEPGGVEKAARNARYEALYAACEKHRALVLFLGHTLDDQAEQVLLGLARGAGARSLAGIPSQRGIISRPFLGSNFLGENFRGRAEQDLSGLWRKDTEAICQEAAIVPWQDPMNFVPEDYRRVAARQQALPALQAALGEHVKKNLVRSSELLADDASFLEQVAVEEFAQLYNGGGVGNELSLNVYALTPLHRAIRTRVIKLAVDKAGELFGAERQKTVLRRHILHIDALITAYRGQAEVFLPGKIKVIRKNSKLIFTPGEPARGSQAQPSKSQPK